MKVTRKDFLKTAGAGMLGAAAFGTLPTSGRDVRKTEKLNFGMASYSLREFSLEKAITMTGRLGLEHIALKSMHMPLDSSPGKVRAMAANVRNAGINLYGAGVIYMSSEKEVNNAFEYAKTAGLKVIIGVPNHDLLPLVSRRVKEYDIKMAIHNHGPGDEQYPGPDEVYEKIKDLDDRVGLCIDIGHTYRFGQDPAQKARQYAGRLWDVHFKDVDQAGKEGVSVECGRGVIDLPAFLETLRDINYKGIVALEYEKDAKDPLPGAAESVGYARGVMDVLEE